MNYEVNVTITKEEIEECFKQEDVKKAVYELGWRKGQELKDKSEEKQMQMFNDYILTNLFK